MIKIEPWFQQAQEELNELQSRGIPLRGGDAWRALVLDSRIASAPLSFQRARLQEDTRVGLANELSLPDPREMLEDLADNLESGEEPTGPALDSVLDLDDLIGVLGSLGRLREAEDLASRAAAVLSLFPELLLPMGKLAEQRLSVLADWGPQRVLWQSIEDASTSILRQQMRGAEHHNEARLQIILDTQNREGGLERAIRRSRSTDTGHLPPPSQQICRLPIQPFRAAASTSSQESFPILSLDGDQLGLCYWREDTGGWEIDIRLDSPERTPSKVELVAVEPLTSRVMAASQLAFQQDGRDLYVNLPGGGGLPLELDNALKREERTRNQIELRLILHE